MNTLSTALENAARAMLCALPGGLPLCNECQHRPQRIPLADEPQQWFTPKKGIGTCLSFRSMRDALVREIEEG